MSGLRRLPMSLVLLASASCSAQAEPSTVGEGCRILQRAAPLSAELDESSGIAASRRHSGIFWTHNDSGGDPVVFAVRANGEMAGRTRLDGAENEDWEDVAVGPCSGGDCLYVADTGDNDHDRDDVVIYRLPEPAPGTASVRPERFPIRYPDGRRDVEALFVLPGGEMYLISKGRDEPETLYRYPLPLRAGERVRLERVSDLGGGTENRARLITAAAASPSGEWVAIRKYKLLSIYRARDLIAGRTTPALQMDLTPVGEAQGEGVELLDDGRVVLTSEGGFKKAPGNISVLQCELPGD